MSRDKQIEEMAKALTRYEYSLCDRLPKDKCLLTSAIHAQVSCDYCKIAEFLVNAGYRKASEVALEVISEIESTTRAVINFIEDTKLFDSEAIKQAKLECYRDTLKHLAELKKKYTERGSENG